MDVLSETFRVVEDIVDFENLIKNKLFLLADELTFNK